MDKIKYETIITKRVILTPTECDNIDANIQTIIKKRFGNKFINGYIIADSIEIISRSTPSMVHNKFTGDMFSLVSFKTNIINPLKGNVITGKISGINKAGIIIIDHPFNIIALIEQHENKQLFKDLKKGDDVKLIVYATRFNQETGIITVNALFEDEYNRLQQLQQINKKTKPDLSDSDSENIIDKIGGDNNDDDIDNDDDEDIDDTSKEPKEIKESIEPIEVIDDDDIDDENEEDQVNEQLNEVLDEDDDEDDDDEEDEEDDEEDIESKKKPAKKSTKKNK